MTESETIVDNETLSASGGSTTSAVYDVENRASCTFQFEGDTNSQILDVDVEAQVNNLQSAVWSRLFRDEYDLTATNNDAQLVEVDVEDVEKVRLVISNNFGSPTSLTVRASK